MGGSSLFRRFSFAMAGVTLLSLFAVTRYTLHEIRLFQIARTQADLETRMKLVLPQIPDDADPSFEARLRDFGTVADARLTWILPDGKVVADTAAEAARMESHRDRPEVVEALAGRVGRGSHFSATLLEHRVYVALPVLRDGCVAAVLRASVSFEHIDRALASTERRIALIALLVALLAGVLGLYLTTRIVRPLRDMQAGAERFARGELGFRLAAPRAEEIAIVVRTMNEMAGQLDERIRAIERQRAESDAVLSSMEEGTLAVNAAGGILTMNRSAGEMFGVDPAAAIGRDLRETIRWPELQQFIARTLAGDKAQEAELTLPGEPERFALAHGAPLRTAAGGAVVVLNDITRIRRLQNLRRDFVANVSHELKTPLTSIAGFVETLLDGTEHSPEDTQRFLGIMARQVGRLKTLVDDLLNLSRIEQEAEQHAVELAPTGVDGVLREAIQFCQPRADERGVRLEAACPDGLQARLNADLVERAVANLIDNAIRYSPAGQAVRIEAVRDGDAVRIDVTDRGCGIEARHLPRLFERFYRVDKARSRADGGTGLGLAIVKHIAQAHGGTVGVESRPGEGSRFWIRLPSASPAHDRAG